MAADRAYLGALSDLLSPFLVKGAAGVTPSSFQVLFPEEKDKKKASPYVIFQDGFEVFQTDDPFRALFRLEWLIIRRLLEGVPFLQFHSGAVALGDSAVLFPAESNSGKTTLTVALSHNGLTCLSDEVALVDPDTLRVHSFPRNIHVEPDMRELFARQGYSLKYKKITWMDLEGDNLDIPFRKTGGNKGRGARVKIIVFPRYSPEHVNRLLPLSPAQAFMELVKNEINFHQFRERSVDIVEELVKGAGCYRLETGGLEGAVALIKGLLEKFR